MLRVHIAYRGKWRLQTRERIDTRSPRGRLMVETPGRVPKLAAFRGVEEVIPDITCRRSSSSHSNGTVWEKMNLTHRCWKEQKLQSLPDYFFTLSRWCLGCRI